MKRHRPILYEVFGSQGNVKRLDGLSARPLKTPKVRKRASPSPLASMLKAPKMGRGRKRDSKLLQELRISYQLMAVLAVVAVVLGGTLYYFAYVRGKASGPSGRLSAAVPSANGPEVPGNGGGAAEPSWATTGYHTVVACTLARDQEDAVFRAWDHLEAEGFDDVHALAMSGQLRLCLGHSADKGPLKAVMTRVQRVLYEGRRDFAKAYVAWISPSSEGQ